MITLPRILPALSLLLALLLALPRPGFAASGQGGDVVSVQLIPGWRKADGTHLSALRITLAPGWKTYWRAPGEAGIPPVIDWQGSGNLADARLRFPQPSVYEVNGFRTVGYSGEVVLPLELVPQDRSGTIRVDAVLELGVCEDICMPTSLRIRAELTADGRPVRAIQRALAAEPRRISAQPKCRVGLISDGVRVTAELPRLPMISGRMAVLSETRDPRIWVSETVLRREGGKYLAEVDFVPPRGTAMIFDRSALRLTVLGAPGEAVEMLGCAS